MTDVVYIQLLFTKGNIRQYNIGYDRLEIKRAPLVLLLPAHLPRTEEKSGIIDVPDFPILCSIPTSCLIFSMKEIQYPMEIEKKPPFVTGILGISIFSDKRNKQLEVEG